MTEAFILGGVRTPVGHYGGSLSHVRTDDLLNQPMAAACECVGGPLGRIEDQLKGIDGRYFEDCNEAAVLDADAPETSTSGVAAYAIDPDAATRLWELSLDLVSPK